MAIKKAKVKTTGKKKVEKKSNIPVVLVPDGEFGVNDIAKYNKAVAQIKSWDKVKKGLTPSLAKLGVSALFEHNGTKGNEVVASVKLVQQHIDKEGQPLATTGDEQVLNVQFKSSYSEVDAEEAEKEFEKHFPDQDINEYAVETVAGTFNSAIWQRKDGSLNKRVYNAVVKAMETLVSDFDLRDDEGRLMTALATQKKIKPKPTLHQQRWEDFTIEEQETLSKIFPNQVALAVQRTK